MKRCSNPNCDSAFLFGDDRTTCPFCHSRLVDNIEEPRQPDIHILPPDSVPIMEEEMLEGNQRREFIKERFGAVECYGRISEIDHHELFNSRQLKLFNSLLYGEPYQFAHQTIEYTIRVENITEGYPTEMTDFCLFGNYLGRLQVGDSVVVRARKINKRRVVKSIFNETTNSVIKPGLQIPAGIIRGVVLTVAFFIIAMICAIVWAFDSGVAAAETAVILIALLPFILFIIGVRIILRSIFPRRRRRR